MKNTHTLTDTDFKQLFDTAILAQMHDIDEEDGKIILTDLEDPETTVTTTRAEVQRVYSELLSGTHPYQSLSKTMQRALELSDEGGFDDCGHADCIAYDAILQIAAYGELTVG